MSEASTNKFSLKGTEDGPLSSMPKGTKPIGSRTKKKIGRASCRERV